MITPLIEKLFPYAYSIASRDSDQAIHEFKSELPFRVHEWPSGLEFNGWQIPPAWTVERATISRNGRVVFDGTRSPLGVVWLSPCFRGVVDLSTLRKHLFWSETLPEATIYHWGALYRPLQRDWGFCVPRKFLEGLSEGEYEVELVTHLDHDCSMKVLDFALPGQSADTIVLNAHNCHPFQANDDLSGCAVAIRAIQALAQRPKRRLTYRVLIAPELVGTTLWLEALGEDAGLLKGAILLKAVGNDAQLRLQSSFSGTSRIDISAHHAMECRFGRYEWGPFRTIYGNDETCFEAPGFEIPSVTLTRMPFDEYHTDLDTPSRISEERLQACLATVLDICDGLEADVAFQAKFRGLVSLSNPRYGLYKPAPAPGLDHSPYTDEMGRWHLLMNCLPRYLDGKMTVLDMARRHGLPVNDVMAYVARWVEVGLAAPVKG